MSDKNKEEGKVYQRYYGEFYVKSGEVVQSEKVQDLLERFTKYVEAENEPSFSGNEDD